MKSRYLPTLAIVGALMWSGVAVIDASRRLSDAGDQRSQPRITAISPATPAKASAPQNVTITGEGLATVASLGVTTPGGQSLSFGGGDLTGRSATSLQAAVTFNAIGRYEFSVTSADGSTSAPFGIEVREAGPAVEGPVVDRTLPSATTRNREPQAFQVEGRGFASGLTALVTDPSGADVPSVVGKVSPSSFELSVRLASAGDYSLVVSNPNGGVSSVVKIEVR
jgi:hypothetical protein